MILIDLVTNSEWGPKAPLDHRIAVLGPKRLGPRMWLLVRSVELVVEVEPVMLAQEPTLLRPTTTGHRHCMS